MALKRSPVRNTWIFVFALAFSQIAVAQELPGLNIGPPLKGAWLNRSMPGQGFLVEVVSEPAVIFIGWFSYPRFSEGLGDDPLNHRWYTIEGSYSGSDVQALIYATTGGSFLGPDAVTAESIGTASMRFSDCNTAELSFHFDDSGESGVIPLSRAIPVDASGCDSLLPGTPVPEQLDVDQPVVFSHVNLLDMPSGTILPEQIVVVENGIITQVSGVSESLIPDDAVVIDGRSRYLLPGMVDTHTHLATNVREFRGMNAPTDMIETSARTQLLLYLAKGVTTILNNGDFGEPIPRWGAEVESGVLTGPSIYAAQYARGDASTADGGPDIRSVTGAAQARQYTRDALAAGYQFMKIYNQTPRAAVLAILDEAHQLGMPVIGHLPQTLSAEETLDSGLDMVAHSGAYLWRYFNNDTGSPNWQVNFIVARSLNDGTTVTATMGIEELIGQIWCNDPDGVAQYWAREETRYMHPTTVSLNNRSITANWRWNPDGCVKGGYAHVTNFLQKLTLKLHEAGVPLTMGTDSPTVLGMPGFSAIDEVRALVHCGIPLLDAIRIATWNGGQFISNKLALSTPIGAIRAGWRADMILLESNPLDNADNLENITGVMAGGRWKSAAFFESEMQAIATLYGN